MSILNSLKTKSLKIIFLLREQISIFKIPYFSNNSNNDINFYSRLQLIS